MRDPGTSILENTTDWAENWSPARMWFQVCIVRSGKKLESRAKVEILPGQFRGRVLGNKEKIGSASFFASFNLLEHLSPPIPRELWSGLKLTKCPRYHFGKAINSFSH